MEGTARPSFINSLLEEYEKTGKIDLDHEEEIKAVGSVLYGGMIKKIWNFSVSDRF